METFDIIILLISVIALLVGYATGLIMQLAILAGVVVGAFFSGQLAVLVVPVFTGWTGGSPHIIALVSYIVAFIVLFILVLLAGRLLQSLFEAVKINIVNRIAGAAFSLVAWIVLAGIAVSVIEKIDSDNNIITQQIRQKSITYHYVKEVAGIIAPYLAFGNEK